MADGEWRMVKLINYRARDRVFAQDHFARVRPIVGDTLAAASVALVGLPQAAPLVRYLAACGVRRWVWVDPPDDSSATLQTYLRAQHGEALSLEARACPWSEWVTTARREKPDLLLAVGGRSRLEEALAIARQGQLPALLVAWPTLTQPCQAIASFPGDPPLELGVLAGRSLSTTPVDEWGWATAAPLCAGLARTILLRHTPYARADLAALWPAGLRVMTLGGPADPLAVAWSALPLSPPAAFQTAAGIFRTPQARRGKLLIAGLGSLGSLAAMHLVDHAAGLILADPDRVDPFNPVRQAYPLAAIGRPKAQALAGELLAAGRHEIVALTEALVDEAEVEALVNRYGLTAALVVTGTAADFAIARALRRCDVPHLVGRCYPRARYWEAIIVDGRRGPALSDIRGRLPPGPAPPPTPEQIAAYSEAGALEAEPATLIESGWAAVWLARLTAQLLAPPGLRERWFLNLLAAEQTCLVGGVEVESTPRGPAYGVEWPGMIRGWRRANIGLS